MPNPKPKPDLLEFGYRLSEREAAFSRETGRVRDFIERYVDDVNWWFKSEQFGEDDLPPCYRRLQGVRDVVRDYTTEAHEFLKFCSQKPDHGLVTSVVDDINNGLSYVENRRKYLIVPNTKSEWARIVSPEKKTA